MMSIGKTGIFTGVLPPNEWYICGHSTHHFTPTRSLFLTYTPCSNATFIDTVVGRKLPVLGYGTVSISGFKLSEVYHVPDIKTNHLSIKSNLEIDTSCKENEVPIIYNGKQVMKAVRKYGSWILKDTGYSKLTTIGLIGFASNPMSMTGYQWLITSASTNHCTPHRDLFEKLLLVNSKPQKYVELLNDCKCIILGVGAVNLNGFRLKKVFYVPDIKINVISAKQLCEDGYAITIVDNCVKVKAQNGTVVMTGFKQSGGYIVEDQELYHEHLFASKAALPLDYHFQSYHWIVCLSASKHYCAIQEFFEEPEPKQLTSKTTKNHANGFTYTIEGSGTIKLMEQLTLKNVRYCPTLATNIISVNELKKDGFKIKIDSQSLTINRDDQVVLKACIKDGLYVAKVLRNIPIENSNQFPNGLKAEVISVKRTEESKLKDFKSETGLELESFDFCESTNNITPKTSIVPSLDPLAKLQSEIAKTLKESSQDMQEDSKGVINDAGDKTRHCSQNSDQDDAYLAQSYDDKPLLSLSIDSDPSLPLLSGQKASHLDPKAGINFYNEHDKIEEQKNVSLNYNTVPESISRSDDGSRNNVEQIDSELDSHYQSELQYTVSGSLSCSDSSDFVCFVPTVQTEMSQTVESETMDQQFHEEQMYAASKEIQQKRKTSRDELNRPQVPCLLFKVDDPMERSFGQNYAFASLYGEEVFKYSCKSNVYFVEDTVAQSICDSDLLKGEFVGSIYDTNFLAFNNRYSGTVGSFLPELEPNEWQMSYTSSCHVTDNCELFDAIQPYLLSQYLIVGNKKYSIHMCGMTNVNGLALNPCYYVPDLKANIISIGALVSLLQCEVKLDNKQITVIHSDGSYYTEPKKHGTWVITNTLLASNVDSTVCETPTETQSEALSNLPVNENSVHSQPEDRTNKASIYENSMDSHSNVLTSNQPENEKSTDFQPNEWTSITPVYDISSNSQFENSTLQAHMYEKSADSDNEARTCNKPENQSPIDLQPDDWTCKPSVHNNFENLQLDSTTQALFCEEFTNLQPNDWTSKSSEKLTVLPFEALTSNLPENENTEYCQQDSSDEISDDQGVASQVTGRKELTSNQPNPDSRVDQLKANQNEIDHTDRSNHHEHNSFQSEFTEQSYDPPFNKNFPSIISNQEQNPHDGLVISNKLDNAVNHSKSTNQQQCSSIIDSKKIEEEIVGCVGTMNDNLSANEWQIDYMASCHCASDPNLFDSYQRIKDKYVFANDTKYRVKAIGQVSLGGLILSKVYLVPKLLGNYLSIHCLSEAGYTIKFENKDITIEKEGNVLCDGSRRPDSSYILTAPSSPEDKIPQHKRSTRSHIEIINQHLNK